MQTWLENTGLYSHLYFYMLATKVQVRGREERRRKAIYGGIWALIPVLKAETGIRSLSSRPVKPYVKKQVPTINK